MRLSLAIFKNTGLKGLPKQALQFDSIQKRIQINLHVVAAL